MESKCPVCITGTLEDWNRKARQCDSCGFQCDAEDLPRIAAAMELARTLVVYEKEQTPLGVRKAGSDLDHARKRVLKVFGGE